MKKRKLSFWEIWNMSFGFLGIQFGFALTGGFMSGIFQTLGTGKDAIPLLWMVVLFTGLLVQLIIRCLGDRTWSPGCGRRRINHKYAHMVSLLLGGVGFISMYHMIFPDWSVLSFIAVGCAWGSILSMPYATWSSSVNAKKMCVIMGISIMTIVIPLTVAAVGGLNFAFVL